MAGHGPALRRLVAAWERDAAARRPAREILLVLWRALPRFRGEATETFVVRVAHNVPLRCGGESRSEPPRRAWEVAGDAIGFIIAAVAFAW